MRKAASRCRVVDNAFAYVNNQRGNSNLYMSQGNLQASKFGLLGAEDLDGGTKVIFRLESGFNSLNGAQASAGYMFNRQTWTGLSNERYGTLTMGRPCQYTPYFNMVGAIGPTGMLTGAHPGDVDALDTMLRFNNSVTYASLTIAGLAFSAQYTLGGQAGSIASDSHFSVLCATTTSRSRWGRYVKLKNIATSSALGTFAVKSPVNKGGVCKCAQRAVGRNSGNIILIITCCWASLLGLTTTCTTRQAQQVERHHRWPARYQQASLEQTYALSARTTFYALQAYQHASGKSLIASGNGPRIAETVAVVGDSQNASSSLGPSHFVAIDGRNLTRVLISPPITRARAGAQRTRRAALRNSAATNGTNVPAILGHVMILVSFTTAAFRP